MKTVFISILAGVEAKNILRTNILATLLKEEDLRLVLFVKSEKRVAFYEKDFKSPHLIYEVLAKYQTSWGDRFVETLKHYLVRTKTLFLYKTLALKDSHNYFVFLGSTLLSWVLGWSLPRRIVRAFDYHFIKDPTFASYFETYNPEVVFLANLFDGMEISLLREAKRRNIKTIGFINSWDKVTAKGFVRMLPDTLIVPNEIVKGEAMRLVDMPEKKIVVSGVPQYDAYITKDGLIPRENFFKKINIDPQKKLVVYAPMGSAFSNSDWDVIDMLHEVIEKEVSGADLLVRFQPNDFFDQKEITSRPWLHYDLPGTRFGTERGVDWDMSFDELLHLKNTLHHAALIISYASSFSIDASMFGKPVINLNFELRKNEPAIKTPTLRYGTYHYQKALSSGGIRLVGSREELIVWIKKYLENPKEDEAGRKRLVHEQCWKTDGGAGERIARTILTALKNQ
jgi:CDP-glycerol glycerophosphotransferase (TagB/SpsB family)